MRSPVFAVCFFIGLIAEVGSGVEPANPAEAAKDLPASLEKLLPLHTRLGPPKPGDWRREHPEPDQTYSQYLASRPVRIDRQRKVLYIQPLGEFDATQRKILDETAEYLGIYFQIQVKTREDLPLSVIPARAQRDRRDLGWKQILSTYVLDEVLRPKLPDDACAYLALTTSDLWPGQGWNFVFGQASITERVGVWSIWRNGDPHGGEDPYRLCLRRTLKTASHETGHIFSMQHCTFYECNMCGSNHRDESDRQPLWLCPICLAKLCHATGADPLKRYQALARFANQHGLKPEEEFYEKAAARLKE
jgi:archaemetzincin